jgi:hypothetical protein
MRVSIQHLVKVPWTLGLIRKYLKKIFKRLSMKPLHILIVLSTLLLTAAHALPDCPKDQVSSSYHNCYGTFTWVDGTQYVGEYKDDKQHGQGAFTLPDGTQYVGEWKDNKQYGQGTETYSSGSQYVGEFKDGKRHGKGTYTFSDGRKYVGEHKDGEWHGQGTLTYPDGRKYAGEFKDGKVLSERDKNK